MKKYDRLIFLSKDDTSEGPMCEAILQSKYLLDELEITSRGLVVLFPEPINPKAEAVLVSKGLSMKEHRSEPLVQEDFDDRTLLITMTDELRKDVLEAFPSAREDLVQVLSDFVHEEGEPEDPYGKALVDYGKCYEELEALITKLVIQLNEEEWS